MTIEMNIIFLDFDGVLVPYDIRDKRDFFGTKFDNRCVHALRKIVDKSNFKIVIVSSWTNHLSLLALKVMWKFRNMPGIIYGAIKNDSWNRSSRIDRWLAAHSINN